MTAEEFIQRLEGARQGPGGDWFAKCPAHDDKNGSLHVTRTDAGKIILHCFAGCTTESVLRSMGITWADMPGGIRRGGRYYGCTLQEYADHKKIPRDSLEKFHLRDGTHHSRSSNKDYPAVYMPYIDEKGTVVRTRKRLMLRKEESPDGPKRFLWDMAGAGMCLYGLWRQPEDKSRMILVEGESDCHTLWNASFPALGIPGVSNFRPDRDDAVLGQYQEILVHIEPDGGGKNLFQAMTGEDGRGRASSCLEKMRFWTMEGYKDPSDAWCALYSSPDAYRALLEKSMGDAKPWKEFPQPEAWKQEEATSAKDAPKKGKAAGEKEERSPSPSRGRRSTDWAGIAEEFMAGYKMQGCQTLIHWRQGWYLYDGRCYHQMVDSDMEGHMMAFLQSVDIQDRYACQPTTSAVKNALMNLRSCKYAWIPQDLSAPSWIHDRTSASGWLPMENCLLDIEKAAEVHLEYEEEEAGSPSEGFASTYSRPCSPDLLATYAMPYSYQPDASCPKFLAWLESTQPDSEMRAVIQMLMGLCLVPDASYNVCFFLYGDAGTGKTTFLRILERLVGRENCAHVPLLKFADRFQTWPLAEKLVNIVGELPSDDPQGRLRYIEGDFKDSISGEMIDCERKGKDVCKARCIARHVFATNCLPKFFDKSDGIWDRLRIIPFSQRFRGTASQVKSIEETFIPEELPGIFNFALVGLGRLRRLQAFPESPAMADAKREHQMACDPDKDYLLSRYERQEGAFLPLTMAYSDYKSFLDENGFRLRSSTSFVSAVLSTFGIRLTRLPESQGRARGFRGLSRKLKTDPTM